MSLCKIVYTIACGIALAASVPSLRAQSATPADIPTQYTLPEGTTRFTLQPLLSSIKSAPISASFQSENKELLADGTTITNARSGKVARDSEGRTYHEITTTRGPAANPPSYTSINISDPVSGVLFVLDPVSHTARRYERTPRSTTAVPKLRPATPANPGTVTTGSVTSGGISRPPGIKFTPPAIQKQDLGEESIDGIPVLHYRQTQTIAAGEIGNDRDLVITSEFWYSKELRMNLKSTRQDPRLGEETLTLSDIEKVEPPASLFQVPPDFEVTDVPRG
jgi:hypothetical protein